MKHSGFTEEQIVGNLKEREAGTKMADVSRNHGGTQRRTQSADWGIPIFKACYGIPITEQHRT
jgi:hypothetical protein